MMKSNIDPLLPENREEDRTKRKSQKDKKKYITMIFSVIIAVGLWIFVIGNENPTIKMTYSNIPIEYLNEDSLEEDGLGGGESHASGKTGGSAGSGFRRCGGYRRRIGIYKRRSLRFCGGACAE